MIWRWEYVVNKLQIHTHSEQQHISLIMIDKFSRFEFGHRFHVFIHAEDFNFPFCNNCECAFDPMGDGETNNNTMEIIC